LPKDFTEKLSKGKDERGKKTAYSVEACRRDWKGNEYDEDLGGRHGGSHVLDVINLDDGSFLK